MTNVLAIDQGTSGMKAIVVNEAGGIVGLAEVPVRPKYCGEGAVEQGPIALLDSVVEAGRAAMEETGTRVELVTLANQTYLRDRWISSGECRTHARDLGLWTSLFCGVV